MMITVILPYMLHLYSYDRVKQVFSTGYKNKQDGNLCM